MQQSNSATVLRTYDWDHAPISQEKIKDLVLDWGLYPRHEVDHHSVVLQYAKALQAGVEFPTIKVGLLEGKKIIVDGMHRVAAHKVIDHEYVTCSTLSFSSKAELFAEAVRLNSSHGRRFTNIELKDNIKRLQKFKFSAKDISALVHVPASEIYRDAATPIAVLTLPSGRKMGIGGSNSKPDEPGIVQLKNSLKFAARMAERKMIPIQNAETAALLIRCYLALGKTLSNA